MDPDLRRDDREEEDWIPVSPVKYKSDFTGWVTGMTERTEGDEEEGDWIPVCTGMTEGTEGIGI